MILHLLESNKGGGAESVVQNLLAISKSEGITSDVAFLESGLILNFVNYFKIKPHKTTHIHSLRLLLISSLFYKKRNTKYFYSHFNYSRLKRLIIRILTTRHKIIAVGNVGYEKYLKDGVKKSQLILIHNTVLVENKSLFKISKNFEYSNFCWIGSLKKGKNWEHIFEIAEMLESLKRKIKINVYGTGPDILKFKENLKKYKGDNVQIIYHGFSKNIISILLKNEILIYTAYNNYEMAPMILLESEITGIKVAAYNSEVNQYFFKEGLPNFPDKNALVQLIIKGGYSVNSNANLEKTKMFLQSCK